jgi:PAS domain S-box-containing protein
MEDTDSPTQDADAPSDDVASQSPDTGSKRGCDADFEALGTPAPTERFAALFDNTTDAIVAVRLVDDAFVVTDVNPAFEDTFGYERERLLGEDLDEFVMPDGDAEVDQSIGDRMKAGVRVEREVRRLTADGPRHFIARTVPLDLDGGWVEGFVIYTDITEQKTRQRQLERFAGVASHDLRNPLQVAFGRLDAALADPADATEHIETALASLDRMNELIEGLLALTGTDSDSLRLTSVRLRSACSVAWEQVETTDANLVLSVGTTRIQADQGRLEQLLTNLFRNCVEHGSTGSRTESDDAVEHGSTSLDSVTVTVGLLPDADEGSADGSTGAGFYVADDGPGIPADDREAVFGDGYTTSAEGTGLGLSIVAQIASAHGWDVSVTESKTGGTRIEIRGVEVDREGNTD